VEASEKALIEAALGKVRSCYIPINKIIEARKVL
jgi:hypothetical protein